MTSVGLCDNMWASACEGGFTFLLLLWALKGFCGASRAVGVGLVGVLVATVSLAVSFV